VKLPGGYSSSRFVDSLWYFRANGVIGIGDRPEVPTFDVVIWPLSMFAGSRSVRVATARNSKDGYNLASPLLQANLTDEAGGLEYMVVAKSRRLWFPFVTESVPDTVSLPWYLEVVASKQLKLHLRRPLLLSMQRMHDFIGPVLRDKQVVSHPGMVDTHMAWLLDLIPHRGLDGSGFGELVVPEVKKRRTDVASHSFL
jgi:hypothetical protein